MSWKAESVNSQAFQIDWLVIGAAVIGIALAVATSIKHDPTQDIQDQSHHIRLTINS